VDEIFVSCLVTNIETQTVHATPEQIIYHKYSGQKHLVYREYDFVFCMFFIFTNNLNLMIFMLYFDAYLRYKNGGYKFSKGLA
jgi:hypothetical protein